MSTALFIPLDAVPTLSVPPIAVTDGSPDPEWVDLPCQTGWTYGRRRTLRLPFDAATAATARRWTTLDRRDRTVWRPLGTTLGLAGAVPPLLPGYHPRLTLLGIVAVLAGLALSTWTSHQVGKATVAQHPQMVGRFGVHLPAMSAAAAAEWTRRNPAAQIVTTKPRWRRFSSRTYLWASFACAVAATGIWWADLRDGDLTIATLFAGVLLLGATVVSLFHALPVGLIRFDDGPNDSR